MNRDPYDILRECLLEAGDDTEAGLLAAKYILSNEDQPRNKKGQFTKEANEATEAAIAATLKTQGSSRGINPLHAKVLRIRKSRKRNERLAAHKYMSEQHEIYSDYHRNSVKPSEEKAKAHDDATEAHAGAALHYIEQEEIDWRNQHTDPEDFYADLNTPGIDQDWIKVPDSFLDGIDRSVSLATEIPKPPDIVVHVAAPVVNLPAPVIRMPRPEVKVNVAAPVIRVPKSPPPDINVKVDVPKQETPVVKVEAKIPAPPNVVVNVPKQEPPVVNINPPIVNIDVPDPPKHTRNVTIKKGADGIWTGEVRES